MSGTERKRPIVLLVGPLPEPKGGVSIHVLRLKRLLISRGYDVCVVNEGRSYVFDAINLRRLEIIRYILAAWKAKIIHVHTSNVFLRACHVLLARALLKPVILTVHSSREVGLRHMLSRQVACWATTVVFVSDRVAARFGRSGHVVPAFLPPADDELSVCEDVADWIALQHERGLKVLASNASRLNFYAGQDLYGLDLIISAMDSSILRGRYACIFVLASSVQDQDYVIECRKRISALGIEDKFWLLERADPFSGIAKRSDAVLRATNTDGDSISVREALYLGVPVIASDAADRPEGARVFRSRDVGSLVDTIISTESGSDYSKVAGAEVLDLYQMTCPTDVM